MLSEERLPLVDNPGFQSPSFPARYYRHCLMTVEQFPQQQKTKSANGV
jgi:hypothetical protein